VILNTGADGPENSMHVLGGCRRMGAWLQLPHPEWPGQCDSLWVRKLYFRPDWERVITPVLDAMLRHREVDPKRIALVGVSQGGYWKGLGTRAPYRGGSGRSSVWDVSVPWMRNLPKFARDVLDAGKKTQFDQMMQMGTHAEQYLQLAGRDSGRLIGLDPAAGVNFGYG
jgi:hypothetical protein